MPHLDEMRHLRSVEGKSAEIRGDEERPSGHQSEKEKSSRRHSEYAICYQKDVQRATWDEKFATIIFDGTDSSYCYVPQAWREHVRVEQESNSFVEQKIQSVLIHGVALSFYVVTPFVSTGMDLTVSVLLDALSLLSPEVETVRFQMDGELFLFEIARFRR